jgi:hypothetical protein
MTFRSFFGSLDLNALAVLKVHFSPDIGPD